MERNTIFLLYVEYYVHFQTNMWFSKQKLFLYNIFRNLGAKRSYQIIMPNGKEDCFSDNEKFTMTH